MQYKELITFANLMHLTVYAAQRVVLWVEFTVRFWGSGALELLD